MHALGFLTADIGYTDLKSALVVQVMPESLADFYHLQPYQAMNIEKKRKVSVRVVPCLESSVKNIDVAMMRAECLEADLTLRDIKFKRYQGIDESGSIMFVSSVYPGKYRIIVGYNGSIPESRDVTITDSDIDLEFSVFDSAMPYYYSSGKRTPLERPREFAVMLNGRTAVILLDVIANRNLTLKDIRYCGDSIVCFLSLPESGWEAFHLIYKEIADIKEVVAIGAIVGEPEGVFGITTRVINVEMRPGIDVHTILGLSAFEGFRIGGNLGSPNTFYLVTDDLPGYNVIDACNRIVESGLIVGAENVLVSPAEHSHMAVQPTDFLFPYQWHLSMIHAPEAWALLQNEGNNLAFGSADIILAVLDDGGVPETPAKHPDFDGDVVGGSLAIGPAKMYKYFDFRTGFDHDIEGPLDKPYDASRSIKTTIHIGGGHGLATAALATALANNGQNGKQGVVGVIPNARLISAWMNFKNNSLGFAHILRYIGGLEPGWSSDGVLYRTDQSFPPNFNTPENPGPGASIISLSLSFKRTDAPKDLRNAISDVMWYGRNRRGTLVLFSAGNSNIQVLKENNQAAFGKITIVGGSGYDHTYYEKKAAYSSWGEYGNNVDKGSGEPTDGVETPSNKQKRRRGRKLDGMWVDFSAPTATYASQNSQPYYESSDGSQWLGGPWAQISNRRPLFWGVVTAEPYVSTGEGYDTYSSHLMGSVQVESKLRTAILVPLPSFEPAYQIEVPDVNGPGSIRGQLAPGMAVLIGNPNDPAAESAMIMDVEDWRSDGFLRISLRHQLYNAHPENAPVYFGNPAYTDEFSGTSASCPIAAGVAGLVMSAKPTLTNMEVRQIMRETAVKIDVQESKYKWYGMAAVDPESPSRQLGVGSSGNPLRPISKDGCLYYLPGSVSSLSKPAKKGSSRIYVSDRSKFKKGQAVTIGARTILSTISVADRRKIYVVDNTGFEPGRQIRIGGGPTTYVVGRNVIPFDETSNNPHYDFKSIIVNSTDGFDIDDLIHIETSPLVFRVEAVRSTKFVDRKGFNDIDGWPVLELDKAFNNSLWTATLQDTDPGYEDRQYSTMPLEVTKAYQFEAIIESIETDGTIILDAPVPADHPYMTMKKVLVELVESESTYIIDIPPDDGTPDAQYALDVYPITRAYLSEPLPPIHGGYTPYYNWGVGHGRVDAAAAVTAALEYKHTYRDLIIRKAIGDKGEKTFEPKINTPDLWLVHEDDKTGISASLRVAQDAEGPHTTKLDRSRKKFMFVRVMNRGVKYESIDASVRFYIGVFEQGKTLGISDFSQWQLADGTDSAGNVKKRGWELSKDYSVNGAQYLGEEYLYPIFDQESRQTGGVRWPDGFGIPPGKSFVAKSDLWKEEIKIPDNAEIPPKKRIYIMAEITPHDGVVTNQSGVIQDGNENIRNNNNLVFRELAFVRATVKGDSGNLLPKSLNVPRTGELRQYEFRLDVEDTVGYFMAEKVAVEVTRIADGQISKATYSYREQPGGTFAWEFDSPVSWITIGTSFPLTDYPLPAVRGIPAVSPLAATGDLFAMHFAGSFSADKNCSLISISSVVYSDDGEVEIGRDTWTAHISESVLAYTDLDLVPVARPSLSSFADMSLLDEQLSDEMAYGPQSTSLFRTTNSFTSQAQSVPAYAAADGVAMIQRIVDPETGLPDEERVNLVIAPRGGSGVDIQPVKYCVYRGLRIGDFLSGPTNGNGGTDYIEVRSRPVDENDTSVSAFIREIYRGMDARIDEMNAAGIPQGDIPDLENNPLASTILGWDPAASLESTNDLPLEDFFNRFDTVSQLPLVRRGMHLGDFYSDDDAQFGIDIALEGEYAAPLTLEYARRAYYEINLLEEEPASEWEERRRREDVRNFVDAAAYYGMHHQIGVYDHQGTLKQGDDLYDDLLLPFINRNRVYIDIRNEAGYSMNYYGNYEVGGAQVKAGSDPGAMYPDVYATDGWPIGMIERSHTEIVAGENGTFYLSLAVADNTLPLLYVEQGTVKSQSSGRFVPANRLVVQGDDWTLPVGFGLRQAEEGGQTRDVAGMLRLRYLRQIPAVPEPPVESVVKTERYTDNIFGPVDAGVIWDAVPGDSPMTHLQHTRWDRLSERRYVDGRETGHEISFGALMERGVVIRSGQVLFYNLAVDFYSSSGGVIPKGRGVTGGFSPQQNFLEASSIFDGYDVESTEIASPVSAKLYTLIPRNDNVVREGVMILGITAAERTLLADAAAVALSSYHNWNIVLEELQINGAEASVYNLKVRGLHASTHQSFDAEPASEIRVYSKDGLFFVSAAFTMPDFLPDTYLPDAEELRADTPEPESIVAGDPAVPALVAGFESAVIGVADNDQAVVALKSAIDTYGEDLWDAATTFTLDGGADDRILYWARLKMAAALKGHPRLLKDSGERRDVVRYFEEVTRGLSTATFAGAATGSRKILLVGFDPYALGGAGIINSNSGGMAALGLHGENIEYENGNDTVAAHINSVILPVRYRDFDDGMVERLFTPYLHGEHKVDMIVAVNMNGGHDIFSIARFAGRARTGGMPDNNDRKASGAIGSGTGWNEFYPANLPIQKMMEDQIGRTPQQLFFYDQSYRLINSSGDPVSHGRAGIDAGVLNLDQDEALTVNGTAVAGSAGSYLPNEFFYRLARLRNQPPEGLAQSDVRVGYIGIPTVNPSAVPGGGLSRNQILAELAEALTRGLAIFLE